MRDSGLAARTTAVQADFLMRRISLRPADPSSVREGELKRQRDVAIEQVPALGVRIRDGRAPSPRPVVRGG